MSWKVEPLPLEGQARKPYKHGQCSHVIPRIFSAETMRKFPHLKTCQRAATLRIEGELFCTMHGGEKLVSESLKQGFRFYLREDLVAQYNLGKRHAGGPSATGGS